MKYTMKYIVAVGDGMADYPIDELGGRTPLQVADTPNMDSIASQGMCGLFKTIPDGMAVGSDTANLSVMGYDPGKYYTGRGPIEAASMGVELEDNDTAFRCNLITQKDGKIADYCAGHITTEEAEELIDALNKSDIKSGTGEFHLGISYRHLFVLRNAEEKVICTPPHDVIGGRISDYLIKAETQKGSRIAEKLNKMILESANVLENHPVNVKRKKDGKNPANMVWLWGQGGRPNIEPLKQKFGISGAVISAVDLIRGLGVLMGMDVVDVPGATGYYDTNYEGKADHAIEALENHDYVYLHVEGIDEVSHSGDLEMKIKTIEDFDRRVIGRILDNLAGLKWDYKIAVLPDHPTPIKARTHVSDPVPFAVYHLSQEKGDGVRRFDESSVKKGSFGLVEGEEFMRLLLRS